MAAPKRTNPYSVKGFTTVTPKGKALFCQVKEPSRLFNAKGEYSTALVLDPNDEAAKLFIERLEALRDTAYNETVEALGAAKARGIEKADVFAYDIDKDGNETGLIKFKMALKNVDDLEPGRNKIEVVDAKKQPILTVPLVGNGSEIRCSVFANPYYMASTKKVGVSLKWNALQIINLVEFSGGASAFDEEDGYTANQQQPTYTKPSSPVIDLDDDELEF